MAEKQFIVKKKIQKKVVEPVKEVKEEVVENNQEPHEQEEQEPQEQELVEVSLFDNRLARLKERAASVKNVDNEYFKDKFIFGKYSNIYFRNVETNDPSYIVFLFSKKMGDKLELDKQRYKTWVEQKNSKN